MKVCNKCAFKRWMLAGTALNIYRRNDTIFNKSISVRIQIQFLRFSEHTSSCSDLPYEREAFLETFRKANV